MDIVRIARRPVGTGRPCFIIAEAGVNHNGSLVLAKRLIDAAARAGADAVKFQTFKAECLATAAAPKAAYQKKTSEAGESQLQMLKRLELSESNHRRLFDYCEKKGILFLSSPFDEESADFLDAMGVAAFKVPSGELTNLPFLAHLANKGKPLIVSTGMATLKETATALEIIRKAGNPPVILLHCVSRYPAEPSEANLRAMLTMRRSFKVPVGFSDHTPGIAVALAATAMGASIIEKHFTLDRTLPGPDHAASLEPEEMDRLVQGIRTVETAMGNGVKAPVHGEKEIAAVARKSLVSARDLPKGTVLSPDMVLLQRPGTGLPPGALASVMGRRTHRALKAGHLIAWKDLE